MISAAQPPAIIVTNQAEPAPSSGLEAGLPGPTRAAPLEDGWPSFSGEVAPPPPAPAPLPPFVAPLTGPADYYEPVGSGLPAPSAAPERRPEPSWEFWALFMVAAGTLLTIAIPGNPLIRWAGRVVRRTRSISRRRWAAAALSSGLAVIGISFFAGNELARTWRPLSTWLDHGQIAAIAAVAAAAGLFVLLTERNITD